MSGKRPDLIGAERRSKSWRGLAARVKVELATESGESNEAAAAKLRAAHSAHKGRDIPNRKAEEGRR